MHLTSLSLTSFRSYQNLDLKFDGDQNVTVLTGENATGKTNVLEAISVLSLLHSPRTNDDADLMQWEQDYYRITGSVHDTDGMKTTLEVVSQIKPRKERACFINGVKTPASLYIGSLPLIIFTPDDLTLWSGSPQNRRRMLDILLCQVSQSTLQALNEYKKILKQRNTLLKQIKEGTQKENTLDVWDEKLASLGAIITTDRLGFFSTIQPSLIRELSALGEKVQNASFQYVRKGNATMESDMRDELLQILLNHRQRDIQTLSTSVGPHRDDWTLTMDDHTIASFASRGQQRTALLTLLLLQSQFIHMRTGKKPILLFDDVFSELDEHHRSSLLHSFKDNQVIISTVEIDEKLKKNARVLACPLVTS